MIHSVLWSHQLHNVAAGLVLAALVLSFAGCSAARMPVPQELGSSERWVVQGRQGLKLREKLRFGPYEAHDVKRSWTRGRDAVSEPFERNERLQYYSFALRDGGGQAWLVKCSAGAERATVRTPIVDADLRNHSNLDCALSDAQGAATWLLTLKETQERPLEGRLHTETEEYAVQGTNKLVKSLPAAATSGYYLLDGSRAVAAIEVVNKGSVTFHPAVEAARKSLFAAAAAALLLLEDLREGTEA